MAAGPTHASSLEPFVVCRNIVSLSLFHTNRMHYFSVTIRKTNRVIPLTARLELFACKNVILRIMI